MFEIDEHEIAFLLDQFIALRLADTPQKFIDDIF